MDSKTPVVFKSLSSIPNYEPPAPEEILNCTNFQVHYHKPDLVSNGYYNLVSLEDSKNVIKLYQSAMRMLVKNLEDAFKIAASIEKNVDSFESDEIFDVCELSTYNNSKTHLIIMVAKGRVSIVVQLFTVDDNTGQTYPTQKFLFISPSDDPVALAAFIKKKK